MIYKERVSVTTTGTAGAATGNANSKAIRGRILAVAINFHASAPATTDTTIACSQPFSYNILVVTSSVTDLYAQPRATLVDSANAAITDSYDHFVVDGTINVALAQCDALTNAAVVDIWYEK